MRSLAIVVVALAACASAPQVGKVRFKNAPVVWKVDDRAHVAKKPEERKFSHLLYFFDVFIFNQLIETMTLDTPRRALNVNALDEVPDSTWFTNRIAIRDIPPDEIRRGPYGGGGPVMPIQIRGTKVGGKSIGFIIKDAKGDKFIIKSDELGFPGVETAANVIVQRLMWAAGYNVPDDQIIYVTREELKLADDAEVKDVFGNKRKMTLEDLEGKLKKLNVDATGRYRTNASKFLKGVPIGGWSQNGTRPDDPNDKIAHEHRREVRALYVLYAWLQCTDVKEDNSLDVYVTDPKDKSRNYVLHYTIDFGKSLGANATIPRYAPDGHAARFDIKINAKSFISFGLYNRAWEGTFEAKLEGVGRIDVDHFVPDGYNPQQPYRPFEFVDRFDGYWGAKLIMRFTRDQIRAAVEQGKLEPPAIEYLTETLVGRQKKLARHWFNKVSPLDNFAVEDQKLCFSDLMILYKLDPLRTASTVWSASAYDFGGRSLNWSQTVIANDTTGNACFSGFPVGSGDGNYTILKLGVRRHDANLPPVEVHVGRAPEGKLRIIGVHRH